MIIDIRVFRKRYSLTQAALAEATGTHRNSIIRWEKGYRVPKSFRVALERLEKCFKEESALDREAKE